MVPLPRRNQISLADTPYYHCVSRCVRRAYLCGRDKHTGRSFEHRRQWVEDRLLWLATVFSIDICAYAVMSNHTHVVLHVDTDKANEWNDIEVLTRWHKLFKGTILTRQFLQPTLRKKLNTVELNTVKNSVSIYRKRLYDISWFMRLLNEYIAREANKEDQCTGRFWEGRFKSQALLDETSLAACMAYVDLNPVRANMAKSLEASNHTSISLRIKDAKNGYQPISIAPFVGHLTAAIQGGLPFNLADYLHLLEQTRLVIQQDHPDISNPQSTRLLSQLKLDKRMWHKLTTQFESQFSYVAGANDLIKAYRSPNKSII